jgi:hypothetical protein
VLAQVVEGPGRNSCRFHHASSVASSPGRCFQM